MWRWVALIVVAGVGLGVAIGAAQAPRVVRITAKKFEYEPHQVTLKKGETVVLELTSTDRQHGFKLPAFGLRADVMPGEVARVTITPDKPGSFTFLCDVFCGDGHDEMDGQILVEE